MCAPPPSYSKYWSNLSQNYFLQTIVRRSCKDLETWESDFLRIFWFDLVSLKSGGEERWGEVLRGSGEGGWWGTVVGSSKSRLAHCNAKKWKSEKICWPQIIRNVEKSTFHTSFLKNPKKPKFTSKSILVFWGWTPSVHWDLSVYIAGNWIFLVKEKVFSYNIT